MAHLLLNGVDGSAATIADSDVFDETTTVDMRADVALDSYTANAALVARWSQSLENRAWRLNIFSPSGWLGVVYRDSAGTSDQVLSSVLIPSVVADGERIQLRGLLDTTALTVDFYTRDPDLGLALSSDTSWSALGTQQSITGDGEIFIPTNDAPIFIGAMGGAVLYTNVAAGKFYAAYVRKGGATDIVDVDFADTSTWVFS